MVGVLLVVDPLAEREDGHRKFVGKHSAFAGVFAMAFTTYAWICRLTGVNRFVSRFFCRLCIPLVLCADNTEGLTLDFKHRAAALPAGLFEHLASLEEVLGHDLVFFSCCQKGSPSHQYLTYIWRFCILTKGTRCGTMPNPQKTIENCILMLQHIMDDSTIPRNIRRVADETRQLLTNDSKELGLRAAEAISKIDEISNDPNMPVHARTRIWELVSKLETIPLD